MKFWVGITGVKNPIGDPLRMKACFLRVAITDPLSLAVLENFILTHIFLTQCFSILPPCKNTELVHTAVILLLWYTYLIEILTLPK